MIECNKKVISRAYMCVHGLLYYKLLFCCIFSSRIHSWFSFYIRILSVSIHRMSLNIDIYQTAYTTVVLRGVLFHTKHHICCTYATIHIGTFICWKIAFWGLILFCTFFLRIWFIIIISFSIVMCIKSNSMRVGRVLIYAIALYIRTWCFVCFCCYTPLIL